ncbi:hypothetical protein BTHE_1985 [Bifidobacterium thermophilum]|nr:hypothetical protein BTHE_1985 [Bifidobacterium thermophilum]
MGGNDVKSEAFITASRFHKPSTGPQDHSRRLKSEHTVRTHQPGKQDRLGSRHRVRPLHQATGIHRHEHPNPSPSRAAASRKRIA